MTERAERQPHGLIIVHVDGLSNQYLRSALAGGFMPFVQQLIEREGYEILPYRCGVPSTTPFAQAGILYGDNAEIPSFRWWDKQSGLLLAFGGHSSFRHVAHKYFHGCEPLTRGGACIAACYPAGALETFGIAYRERNSALPMRPHALAHILANWALNPLHILDWLRRGALQVWKTTWDYWRARLRGQPAAQMYVLSGMLEEIFLHQITRYATVQAMADGYPVIYAGFYAYDETAHAFGPDADYSFHILKHVDNTLRRVARQRTAQARHYELVILSDHGQVQTLPFLQQYGRHLADFIAEWLPAYAVEEVRGKKVMPSDALDGHIVLTFSGGLAHGYFRDLSWRLDHDEIEQRFPGLIQKLAELHGIGGVLLRNGKGDVIVTATGRFTFDESELPDGTRQYLAQFDEPEVLARQLHRLNAFERSGDFILYGAVVNGRQINFETQVGGHGSLGGEQLHPFVLAKREWALDTSAVRGAHELHPLLTVLRERVLGPSRVT
jgi:hypothetical protein